MDLLKSEFTCFPLFNYYLSLFIFLLLSFIIYGKLPFEYTYRKESMINRLSNLINRNRSAAKISQVLCSNADTSSYMSGSLRISDFETHRHINGGEGH